MTVPPRPAEAPASLFAPLDAAFPGEHRIALDGVALPYRLRRVRRRTIGLRVSDEGLTVSAARWVPLADIERALQTKAAWILRKLAEQRGRAQQLQAQRMDWADGMTLPFLGEPMQVVLDPTVRGTHLERLLDGDAPPRRLRVGTPLPAEPAQLRDRLKGWLQRQARALFEERCAHFAPVLGVQVTRLQLSSARTRWGSASRDGSIRLHWRLVQMDLPLVDYVVAHELAHLREMNHSPAFWAVVRSVVPDLDARRAALKAQVLPAWE